MSTMPRYEVRYDENGEWIEVSDLDFMDGLYKFRTPDLWQITY